MLVTLCHGMFASGLIPLLNAHVARWASVAFGLYFGGVLVGQLAVYRVAALSRRPRMVYPLYELMFAGSLLYMALLPYGPGLVSGRLLEGLAAGLALPVLFSSVLLAQGWGTAERRIALFNSVFAVGFVLGPLLVAATRGVMGTRPLLGVYAGLFALFAVTLAPLLPASDQADSSQQLRARSALRGVTWFDTFFTLFFAKLFYGFMLAFVTANVQHYFTRLGITGLLLLMSAIFIVGQVLAARLVKVASRRLLVQALPLALGVCLLGLGLGGRLEVIFAAGLVHSILALVGYLNISHRPDGAREFALYNCLSDPGMALGAFIAALGEPGALVLTAAGLVPAATQLLRRR